MKKISILFALAITISSCKAKVPQEVLIQTIEPKLLSYTLVEEYPHNPEFFTQGFLYKDGLIYEGTGSYGTSYVMKYKLGSTTPIQKADNTKDIFGEGITVLDGKIYQISYKERKGFIYDEATLKLEKTFTLPSEIIEGWGMTTIGDEIVVSDSSPILKIYDKDFKLKRTLLVTKSGIEVPYLNELEYIDGYLYANVFTAPVIVKIDFNTGAIVGVMDMSELVRKNTNTNPEAVLNGIAYDGENMLVTGKLWNKIYKIKITN